MPVWPEPDDEVPYTVISLRLSDEAPFLSTVKESLNEICYETDIPLCRVEETETPDDGRILRISIQGDETDAVMLTQSMAEDFEWFRPGRTAKVMTTSHAIDFDCENVWPEDALNAAMAEKGMHRYELTFALPGWFPFTLLGSMVTDSVIGICTEADLSEECVAGVGMDKTTPGFPTIHIWCDAVALAVFADSGLQDLVEECIQYVADEVLVRRWLERTVGDHGHAY